MTLLNALIVQPPVTAAFLPYFCRMQYLEASSSVFRRCFVYHAGSDSRGMVALVMHNNTNQQEGEEGDSLVLKAQAQVCFLLGCKLYLQ